VVCSCSVRVDAVTDPGRKPLQIDADADSEPVKVGVSFDARAWIIHDVFVESVFITADWRA
jgi:hypothetical protein